MNNTECHIPCNILSFVQTVNHKASQKSYSVFQNRNGFQTKTSETIRQFGSEKAQVGFLMLEGY